jgi:PAS domain S-box-containing protein
MTAELASRPARQPDLAAEIQALQILAQQLTDDPQVMLKTLVGIVLDLAQAGTAGVSLLETAPDGESVFRWVAISAKPNSEGTAGAFTDLEHTTTPGDFSLCCTTLRSNQPQLYAYPERYFTYLHHPQCPIVEGLVIPLCVNHQPLGTLWLLSHDEARRFDLEDQRLMTRLAGFAAAALQSMQQVRQKAEDAQRSQKVDTEQAQSAVPLRQSEEVSQQILDSNDDCIKVLDLEGRILFMSPAGQALLGIQDITPFLNTPWATFWEGAAQQAAIEAIAGAKAGEVCTFQGYRPTMTGELKYWDNKVTPIRSPNGQVERLLCISRDITERRRSEDKRRQAEECLRKSEEHLSAIFSRAAVGLSEVSLDGHFQRINDKMCHMLGRSRQDMLAASVFGVTYPEDVPKSLQALQHLVETGEPVSLDKRYLRSDGTIVWANSSLTRLDDEQGRPRTLLAVTVDLSDRKQAEEAIRRSEEKYRTLFESMDEGFCLIEVLFDETGKADDYRFLEANPAFEKHTGLVDAIGKTMHELVPQHDAPWFEIYGEIALTGTPTRFENYASALKRFYDVYAFRVGQPHERKVAVFLKDISDRKQAEESLRESEARLQKAISIETVGVIFFSAEGVITDCNDAFLRMSGYSREDFEQGRVRWDELTPPEWMPASWRAIEEFLTLGRTTPYEKEYIRKDGSRWWGLFAAFRLNGTEGVEFIIDVSERKGAEAAVAADLRDTQLLRDLSARLLGESDVQVLYDEIVTTAIALMQADAGSFQVLDTATQELLLLATQGLSQVIAGHFDCFDRIDASFNTSCGIALATGERSFVDFDVPESEDPNGYRRIHVEAGLLSAQSTPLISRSGKLIGMVSTHWRTHHRPTERELRFLDLLARQAADLIEQRQAEAERKKLLEQEQAAREEAERANRIKDEFLAVLSHELRSPLNPILGWSKLLQKGNLDATRTQHALKTIERNANLQSELIEDLLDVSRILQGKLSLTVSSVNLAVVIRAAMETMRLAAEAKSLQVEARLNPEVGNVSGDATRLQQVIWNLLSNAVKFTPAGGRVTVQLEQVGNQAQVTLSDTGKGIQPEFVPYVFEYFRQEDGATTRKFGGLGLGLAIVRHLVELHGGTVRAESPGEGQGATFVIRLPLMRAASKATQDERLPENPVALNNINILIVDDETDSRELVAFLLEQQGAQVRTAASAHEALIVLSQSTPDVLLSDIGMPEMDGYMLIQQVRTLAPEQGGQIPAIALTAYAGEMNQQQALAAGFQKHISKPVEPQKLIQTISSLIRSA